jgi:hypothetical protein
MSGIKILLDGARGVFIPRDFNDCFVMKSWNLEDNDEDLAILREGPAHDWYWEAWDSIMDKAYYLDGNGYRWSLYQDGDLFAICNELMSDEEYEGFYNESRDPLDNNEQAAWYDTSAELE